MPRIEFDGKGEPIPTIALPPFGSDSDLPPTVLTFTDNADFSVDTYRDLGFTHFEAFVVGAAGGRGADVSNQLFYAIETIRRPVPAEVWNLRREQIRIQDYITAGGVWDKLYSGWNPGNPTQQGTAVDIEEFNNPSHLLPFNTYRQILLYPVIEAMGGAGGGGGFHKVSGVLADLPDSVPIVVGKSGQDAPYGQTTVNGVWTPDMPLSYLDPGSVGYPTNRLYELMNYFTTYLNSYPLPHAGFSTPLAGSDGGYSSFGDVGQASGGKGGAPGKVWNGSQFVVKGEGGAGGIGGRSTAGGGGAGSVAEGVNGSDGVWHPDTGIGAGGGGGKGGLPSTSTGDPRFGVPTIVTHLATAGGQGSYSFGDTSIYGARQFRQPWTRVVPVSVPGSGIVTYTTVTDSAALVIPGGGGGVRPLKTVKAGSRAPGYSPDGVVVLRLTRIV